MKEKGHQSLLTKAHNALILSLGDKPLREVSKQKIAKQIWDKLARIGCVITKSLQNGLFLKQKLYSFWISKDNDMKSQLDDFQKILDDLVNIDVTLQP